MLGMLFAMMLWRLLIIFIVEGNLIVVRSGDLSSLENISTVAVIVSSLVLILSVLGALRERYYYSPTTFLGLLLPSLFTGTGLLAVSLNIV